MGSCTSALSSHPEDSPQVHSDPEAQVLANPAPDDIDLAAFNRHLSTAEAQQSSSITPDNYNPLRELEATQVVVHANVPTTSDISPGLQNSAPAAEGLLTPHTPSEISTADSDEFVTILPSNAEPRSAAPGDDRGVAAFRKRCQRFRILIIGKANAGKTTILQKMCNTAEAPIICEEYGMMYQSSAISPTDGRGIHNIEHQLSFMSNRKFVFHDSPGFEAGSTQELGNVRQFITKRAAATALDEQLHAIWYCLPTDNDRPLSNAEMSFFEQGTGKVPVIAIFTKYDGLILKEYNKLRFEKGYGKVEANKNAPINADDFFRNSEFYLKRLQQAVHAPARYLRVQRLNDPQSNCEDLSRLTLESLDSAKLQLLFVSVQQSNMGWSTKFALRLHVLECE